MDRNKVTKWLGVIYITITGLFNLYGYFHLPETIATQFSFSGESVNHMPAPVYLIGVFLLVVLLSVIGMNKEREQKLKYILAETIIFVANIALIASQL